MKKLLFTLCIALFTSLSVQSQTQVYELRVYQLNFFKSADVLHNYFEKALIPALNKQGAKSIGVFEETGESLPKKIYVLIPHQDIVSFQTSDSRLFDDPAYVNAAQDYLKTDQNSVPYTRITSSLIHSTKEFPELVVPNNAGLFELRIYESQNEAALKSKLKMFEQEFSIFADAGLNMVFYGKNITGDLMPSLTYMLANKDLAENQAGWSKFISHPDWKRLTAIDEFKGNMSNITRVFLKPLGYSQL